MYVRFDVKPVGKPRMTRSDRWKKRPATTKYWQFKDDITKAAIAAGFELPDVYAVMFHVAMPQSWSKKKRSGMLGTVHQQKPDKDNLEKALNDALRTEDSGIWGSWVEKRWADTDAIEIWTGEELNERLAAIMSSLRETL